MRKLLVITLLVMLLSITVGAHELELIESPECLSYCYSLYNVTAVDDSLVLDEQTFWFEFTDSPIKNTVPASSIKSLSNFKVQWLNTTTTTTEEYMGVGEDCTKLAMINGSLQNVCVTGKPVYENITKTTNVYETLTNITIKDGQSLLLRIEGSKLPTANIDNVPLMYNPSSPDARLDGYVKYSEFAWWNTSWSACRVINVTNPVAETLTNFPILLSWNATTTTNASLQNGSDLRFTNATTCNGFNAGDRELPFEIDHYNDSQNDQDYIWVKMNLTASTLHPITMYYNNSAGTLPLGADANGRNNVWDSSFKGVYHFINHETSALNVSDSTSNNRNGTLSGVVNATGKVGTAYDYDGGNDFISLGDNFDMNTGNWTIEALWNKDTFADFQYGIVKATAVSYIFFFDPASWSGLDLTALSAESGASYLAENGSVMTVSGWNSVGYELLPNISLSIFFNGTNVNNNITTPPPNTGDNTARTEVGNRDDGVHTLGFDGRIDEVRFSSPSRSLQWKNATYLFEFNATTYSVLDSEVTSGVTITNGFVSPVFETTNQNYFVNFSWGSDIVNVTSANLTYNNTVYVGGIILATSSTSGFAVNNTVRPPLVPANNSNIAFSWTYYIQYTNLTNTTVTSGSQNQAVYWAYYPQIFTYNASVIESASNDLYINTTLFSNNITNVTITANFDWNGTITANTTNVSYNNNSVVYNNNVFPFMVWSAVDNYTITITPTIGIKYVNDLAVSKSFQRNITGVSQTVFKMILTDCLTKTVQRGINFTILDLDTNLPVNSTSILNFFVWNTSQTNNRYYTLSTSNNNSPQVCIYPTFSTASVLANRNTTVSATGYTTSTLSLNNFTIDTQRRNVSIYLSNNTGDTDIIFNVIDENDNAIENATITVELYNGTYFTISSAITDFNGQHQFTLDATKLYRVNISRSNGTLYNRITGEPASYPPFQILTTELTFRILLGAGTSLQPLIDVQNLGCLLTFNNVTNIFNLTFNDVNLSFSNTCLDTYSINTTDFDQIGTNCTTTDSTSLYSYLGVNATGQYQARGIVTSSLDSENYTCRVLGVIIPTGTIFGDEGTIWAIAVLLVASMLGLVVTGGNPTGAIVGALLGVIMDSIMSLISTTWAGIAGIVIVGFIIIHMQRT